MILLYFCVIVIINSSLAIPKPNINIVLIISDDQDLLLGGLNPMLKTIKYIGNKGISFKNGFVNAPICCPSRSTILTGRYPHNTGVHNNSVSGGCASESWRNQLEPYSIAPLLQKSNKSYRTFYAGKYLNQYGKHETGKKYHVPIGWDSWYGLIGNSRYYNYTLLENGKRVRYKNAYLTDVIKSKAINFLQNISIFEKPIFMVLAPPAPHAPFTPAPRHQNKFPNVTALRTPAFNYTPIDKHWLLRMPPCHLPLDVHRLDEIQKHRFEALLAVDDMVEAVIKEFDKTKQLNNTYFIYTSDNGYHIGQFNQPWDKRQPYDTDIRIPLLIRGPGLIPKSTSNLPFQSVDLAPTILQMAGLPVPNYMDGRAMLKNIIHENSKKPRWGKNILIEYHGEGNAKSNDVNCPWGQDDTLAGCGVDSWCKCQDAKNNTYSCLRRLSSIHEDIMFCRFSDSENFVEAYNLNTDKYQLKNIYKDLEKNEVKRYSHLLDKLLKCKGKECRDI